VSEIALLAAMLRIRRFEQALMAAPGPGFQLLSSGEEAVAVGTCAALAADDLLLCSGRAIGPALARGVPAALVMAELKGRRTGPCKGQAGRGHLSSPAHGLFGAHAVVAGNLTIAAGVALAQVTRRTGRIVACIFGDGACGAGALHETLNLAALWRLPLVLVCANNGYSVSTPVAAAIAAQPLASLAAPFGIPAATVDGMDAIAVRDAVVAAVARAREGGGPTFVECSTYRFSSHSTASRESRPAEEIAAWRARDPIAALARRCESGGLLDAAGFAALERAAEEEATRALAEAHTSPLADPEAALDDVG
jgi:pyruvate dehydrogenase E1 component alpha subunit